MSESKIKSGIVGHAIGDALGVPVEFKDRRLLYSKPVDDMITTREGAMAVWSDDTAMELATIDSYINNNGWNYDDIMHNFNDWLKEGKYTSHGFAFDIGKTCYHAIKNYTEKGIPALESGLNDIRSNGNGSLMRIQPVAYYCFYKKLNNKEIYELVKNISSLTHRHEISILGCYIYVLYIIKLLEGKNKNEAYGDIKKEDYSMFSKESIDVYNRVLKGNIGELDVDDIKSSGYVVDSLESALWSLLNTDNYKESVLKAVNLGGDADTVAAITGSMSGIIYGYDSIPKSWINKLLREEYLVELANKFENMLKK